MAPDILSTTPPRAFLPISGLSSQLWKGMLTNLRAARPWMPSLPVLNVIVCFSSLYLISCTSCVDHNFFWGIQCATNGGSNQIIELGSLKKRIRTRLVINVKMRKKLDASEALILKRKSSEENFIQINFYNFLPSKEATCKKTFHVSSHCIKFSNNYFLSDSSIPQFRLLRYNKILLLTRLRGIY